MAKNSESINSSLFELLRSRGYSPTMLDTSGKEIPIPDEAEVFQFKFSVGDEEYGTVTASIDGLHKLVIYFGDDVADSEKEGSEDGSESWYQLLNHLKRFAQQHQLSFEVKNKDHLKYDMAKRDHMKKQEKIAESYYPMGKKSSYSDNVPTIKIVIEHTRQIEEGEQRYRNVNRIFLENADGERILAPTNKPGVAGIYARHLAEGGKPHDERWNHMIGLCEEYNKMGAFVRATRNNQFNESAQQLVNEGINHYQSLRESLSKMRGARGYNAYFESYTPPLMEDESEENNLNELFVQETLDPRIESVMPILNKLHKKVAEMKEVNELSEWADSLTEIALEEGELGQAVGTAAGTVLGARLGPAGSAIGGAVGGEIGSAIGDSFDSEDLEEGEQEVDEGLGNQLLGGAALLAAIWGINNHLATTTYNNSPQLQSLIQLHKQAEANGDTNKMDDLTKRIRQQKDRLDLDKDEVTGADGQPVQVKEEDDEMVNELSINTMADYYKKRNAGIRSDLADKTNPNRKELVNNAAEKLERMKLAVAKIKAKKEAEKNAKLSPAGDDELSQIRKAAGLPEVKEGGPDAHTAHQKVITPAVQRKDSGNPDWQVTGKDLEKAKEITRTSPEGLAAMNKRLSQKHPMDMEEGDIGVLAKTLAKDNPSDPAGNFIKGGEQLGIFKKNDKRVSEPKILGTQNKAKSGYYPTPKTVKKFNSPVSDQELAQLIKSAGINRK